LVLCAPWDNSNDNTGENLRQAMAQNPRIYWCNLDTMMVLVIILMPSTICGKWILAEIER
jgi:hypothetical protein